ncbi:hypothetical protein ZWY2020_017365 [Hordeum vulgare]|nr:hypothetical protein ZWY2020_017365 [Hordeum vulgare]
MGKAGRWLRSFLPGKKDRGRTPGPQDRPEETPRWVPAWSSQTVTPASTPGAREKRRWSFRRPAAAEAVAAAAGAGKDAAFLEPRVLDRTRAPSRWRLLPRPPPRPRWRPSRAAAVVRYAASAPGSKRSVIGIEEAAAIKIQSVFRSYLARRHYARSGAGELQALVRGHLVRRQASNTLRCMQALVAAQNRARTARLRLLDDERPLRTPRMTPTRRSPHHPRLRQHQVRQYGALLNFGWIIIMDMHRHRPTINFVLECRRWREHQDRGGGHGAGDVHCTPRTSRRSSCYATPLCRTPSKVELYQKVSPTPSALTDASGRSYSGRYDDFSFGTARASPYHYYSSDASCKQPPPPQQQHQGHGAGAGADHRSCSPATWPTRSRRAPRRGRRNAPRQRASVSSAPGRVAVGEAGKRRPAQGVAGGASAGRRPRWRPRRAPCASSGASRRRARRARGREAGHVERVRPRQRVRVDEHHEGPRPPACTAGRRPRTAPASRDGGTAHVISESNQKKC